ncbi:hypothetical protein CKJ81_10925 [Corynebacterium hadale]|uniref:Uncharacterized protein n=1 Tax=Corynebacterium hadale TaxID=2026255 RepID=A0ABX4H777_9CORY|nr:MULTISPECIES: hypothetical protein [Corynebacterium]MCG7255026.1 hypothetical protein [Corynebacterium hadale]MCG7257245.1 hypothetical protein [Corynebacterium hadale]MCG7265932.1 hypothetical protein [Corynebacterium hadale]PAT03045.1 hypothetical protein CKJ85_10280 [Corynebacterium sp. NML 150383]PAT05150.1 hypothetical protein CKJ81_10925 [Corynebacterium hadale]
MRVYIPATFAMLEQLNEQGVLHARNGWGFAATPELTEFFNSGDQEEIEAIAFDDAALASIRLLAIGDEERFPHRRVVVSADVDATGEPDMGESVVKVSGPVELKDVAAVHVDVREAEDATKRATELIDAADLGDEDAELAVGDAQDNYMAFFDPSELPFLIELL